MHLLPLTGSNSPMGECLVVLQSLQALVWVSAYKPRARLSDRVSVQLLYSQHLDKELIF